MKAEILKKVGEVVVKEIGEGYEISYPKVTKNNSFVKQAVVICRTGNTVCPVIYVDGLLNEIESGTRSIQDAADEIVHIYRNANPQQFSDITKKLNKENILKNVVYQLVNTERNVGRLCNMPHKELFDLSAIYKVIVSEDSEGTASIVVSHEFCSAYGISEDELDFSARKNTKNKGFCVMNMADLMADMIGIPVKECQNESPAMFVFTNTEKNNGAAIMLYEEYFGNLAEKLKSDLYVLPSSIHEVIVVPVEGMDKNELKAIVRVINFNEVSDEEVLSENVYQYSIEENRLVIA